MRRARPLLGTLVDIEASGKYAAAAIEAAFGVISEVHRLMSFHEFDSDVSRINRTLAGVPVSISARTVEVLQFAYRLSVASAGRFDVSIGRHMVRAGFLPVPEHASQPVEDASFMDMEFLPDAHIKLHKQLWIDLGGIAKGYAVDCAIQILRQYQVDSALVNAGGDLRLFGPPQPVHVRNPDQPGALINLGMLENCAVATSSGMYSEQDFDALVDRKNNACIRWNQSISVIAPDCMSADALTKIVRLCPEDACDILEQYRAEAIYIVPPVPAAHVSYNNNRQIFQ